MYSGSKETLARILERLISITQLLASYNLAVRRHREILPLALAKNSRNIIDLVKLLFKHDPVL
jgi:hypothetical protein